MPEAGLDELTAAPETLTIAGKGYRIGPLDLSGMGEFERWCRGETIRGVSDSFVDARPNERQEAIREATRAASKLAFHTEEASYLASTAGGMLRIVHLSLRRHHDSGVSLSAVNELAAKDLEGFARAFTRIMRITDPDTSTPEGNVGGKPEAHPGDDPATESKTSSSP